MYTRSLLYWSLLTPVAFIVGFLVEGAIRPGYSAWRHAVSQLSLGPGGPVNVALLLLGAAGLAGLAVALRRAFPGDRPRWTPRLVATAGAALAVLAIFPIDPGLGYPPGQPSTHHWPGLIHGIAGTVLFAALTAAPLTLNRHLRGRAAWARWRTYSLATALTVAVAYVATAVLTSLDQTGEWTNAPAGLVQRIALITGIGWCSWLSARLLAAPAQRAVHRTAAAGQTPAAQTEGVQAEGVQTAAGQT
jgi:hypothetical protein